MEKKIHRSPACGGSAAGYSPCMATTGKPEPTEEDPAKGAAEPEALIDGAECDADTASRLSMAASDPPASWAGPDKPPTNKER